MYGQSEDSNEQEPLEQSTTPSQERQSTDFPIVSTAASNDDSTIATIQTSVTDDSSAVGNTAET